MNSELPMAVYFCLEYGVTRGTCFLNAPTSLVNKTFKFIRIQSLTSRCPEYVSSGAWGHLGVQLNVLLVALGAILVSKMCC